MLGDKFESYSWQTSCPKQLFSGMEVQEYFTGNGTFNEYYDVTQVQIEGKQLFNKITEYI